MSDTTALTNDARVRAFYQGLANDPNATQVSPEALRASADGLAGGAVDGMLSAVETEAMLTIARQADLPEPNVLALRSALRNNTPLDIPRGDVPAGPNRFPSYLDIASLRTAGSTCGCGASAGALADKDGNLMEIIRGQSGLEARFARAGQSLEGAPTIALNAAERAAIAPELVRTILRESQPVAENRYEQEWQNAFSNYTPSPSQVPGERDLSGLRHWSRSSSNNETGERTHGYAYGSEGSIAWIRHNERNPGEVRVAYSTDLSDTPPDSAFRPMSRLEVSTFQASRDLAPVYSEFWVRNFAATQGFVAATRP